MTVTLTADATDDLDEIWRWNARQHGAGHANEYLAFLRRAIDELATTHAQGRVVDGRPDLPHRTVRHRSRGHAHVPVYHVDGTMVTVVRVFHTAQNWQPTLLP